MDAWTWVILGIVVAVSVALALRDRRGPQVPGVRNEADEERARRAQGTYRRYLRDQERRRRRGED